MLAFQKALESGCDGIELDVQLTKDGEVVIIHDEYLDDLTDFTGNVRDYTLGELKSCNAGGKWQETYGFQPIPTFEEYCEWASGNSLITNVEIKSSVYYYEELEKKTMELIEAKIRSLNPDNQPTVLTADFNKMLDSPIFDGVKKFMADARTTAPVTDNKASFNNFGGATNYPRIDHIFSSGFTPLRFATVDQRYEKVPYISDHYPIAAVLEFK